MNTIIGIIAIVVVIGIGGCIRRAIQNNIFNK